MIKDNKMGGMLEKMASVIRNQPHRWAAGRIKNNRRIYHLEVKVEDLEERLNRMEAEKCLEE